MHALGLIHRDVKPANILLDRERDRAVLVDVGVAVKAGNQRDAAGTPGFAAPESFLEQDRRPDDRRLRPRGDDVLRADRAPAVRLGPGAAGRAAPAQRSADAAVAAAAAACPRPSTSCSARRSHPSPKKRWASASTFAIALGRALERMSGEIRVPATITGPRCRRRRARRPRRVLAPTAGIDEACRPSCRCRRCVPAITGRVRAAHLRVLSQILQHHVGESGIARAQDRASRARDRARADARAARVGRARRARRRARPRARAAAEPARAAQGRPRHDERDVRAPVRRRPDVAVAGDRARRAADVLGPLSRLGRRRGRGQARRAADDRARAASRARPMSARSSAPSSSASSSSPARDAQSTLDAPLHARLACGYAQLRVRLSLDGA